MHIVGLDIKGVYWLKEESVYSARLVNGFSEVGYCMFYYSKVVNLFQSKTIQGVCSRLEVEPF